MPRPGNLKTMKRCYLEQEVLGFLLSKLEYTGTLPPLTPFTPVTSYPSSCSSSVLIHGPHSPLAPSPTLKLFQPGLAIRFLTFVSGVPLRPARFLLSNTCPLSTPPLGYDLGGYSEVRQLLVTSAQSSPPSRSWCLASPSSPPA